jgi:hypothetical protein
MTYALGRSLDYHDMPSVRRIVRQTAADDYRFKSIALGIVSSDAFRKREFEGPVNTDQAPPREKKLASAKSGAN